MPEPRLDVRALYAALDQARRSRDLSWRGVAREAGVSPSTLTRLGQLKRPDVDSFAALVQWLGIDAERFLREPPGRSKTNEEDSEPIAVISSLRPGSFRSPRVRSGRERCRRADLLASGPA